VVILYLSISIKKYNGNIPSLFSINSEAGSDEMVKLVKDYSKLLHYSSCTSNLSMGFTENSYFPRMGVLY
jgi:hypothetical protein